MSSITVTFKKWKKHKFFKILKKECRIILPSGVNVCEPSQWWLTLLWNHKLTEKNNAPDLTNAYTVPFKLSVRNANSSFRICLIFAWVFLSLLHFCVLKYTSATQLLQLTFSYGMIFLNTILSIYIYIDVPWVVRTVQYCTFLKIHIVITEYAWWLFWQGNWFRN